MNAAAASVAVLYYPAKAGAAEVAARLAAEIPPITAGVARALSLRDLNPAALRGHELAVIVGGDGSILGAARLCAPLGIPLLPVQLGRLGQLAEVEAHEVATTLPLYLRGECWRDERLMLAAEVERGPDDGETEVEGAAETLALNDIVVARGVSSGPIRVDVTFGDWDYGTVWADGVIVATPTGSSAYTRSAGGPIIHPAAPSLAVTAIAPQSGPPSLLVIAADESVTLRVTTDAPTWVLLADGLVHALPASGARVTVKRAPDDAVFLRRGDRYRLQRRLRELLIGDPRPRLGLSG